MSIASTNHKTPVQGMKTSKRGEDIVVVKNLKKYFPIRGGFFQKVKANVQAVDDVSFTIKEGETLGLVGESGCGKTTVGRTMLRLTEPTAGEVDFNGVNIFNLRGRELKQLRINMQIIFQDPYASLDPRLPIGESVMEGLKIHGIGTHKERYEIMLNTLHKVGLEDYHSRRYPHEFSGGQRQRIGIARALALNPKLIICDEPVSALDVSVQAQVVNLLQDLQDEFGLTYLFISHGLAVVEHISDRVAVMYLGKIVEICEARELYDMPLHPYTKALLSAIPQPDPKQKRERIVLTGDVPTPINPPSGCRFRTRCPMAIDECASVSPELKEITPGHFAACIRVDGY